MQCTYLLKVHLPARFSILISQTDAIKLVGNQGEIELNLFNIENVLKWVYNMKDFSIPNKGYKSLSQLQKWCLQELWASRKSMLCLVKLQKIKVCLRSELVLAFSPFKNRRFKLS